MTCTRHHLYPLSFLSLFSIPSPAKYNYHCILLSQGQFWIRFVYICRLYRYMILKRKNKHYNDTYGNLIDPLTSNGALSTIRKQESTMAPPITVWNQEQLNVRDKDSVGVLIHKDICLNGNIDVNRSHRVTWFCFINQIIICSQEFQLTLLSKVGLQPMIHPSSAWLPPGLLLSHYSLSGPYLINDWSEWNGLIAN